MKTGWIARAEDTQSQDKVHTLLPCSKALAVKRVEELRKKNESIKIDLVGTYSEALVSNREIRNVVAPDLGCALKEYADLNPLIIQRDGQNFQIEVDKR